MKDAIIKKSKIHGKGVFAGRDFRKGETVLKWNLKVKLTKKEFNSLSEKEKHYVYRQGKKLILLQPPERFVNHSCEPNTKVKNYSDIAIKDIKKREEITGNYSEEDITEFKIKCKCKNKKCRKIISNQKTKTI